MSDSLRPHEPQHARPPCLSPTPGVYSNSCALSRWCHPAISSSVVPFSSHSQSLPASGYFAMSQLFTWGGQSIGVSASTSILPMNTQDWSPLGWTGWISLEYSLTPQFKSLNSLMLNFLYSPTLTSMHDYWKICLVWLKSSIPSNAWLLRISPYSEIWLGVSNNKVLYLSIHTFVCYQYSLYHRK